MNLNDDTTLPGLPPAAVQGPAVLTLAEYATRALNFANVKDFTFNIRHAASGMVTEAGELVDAWKRLEIYGKPFDLINLLEEIGDCMWYANLACHTLDTEFCRRREIPIDEIEDTTFYRGSIGMTGTAAAFGLLGEDQPDPAAARHLCKLVETYVEVLDLIAQKFGFTLEECAARNIAKLDVRYKKGFNQADALNRDLTAERAALDA